MCSDFSVPAIPVFENDVYVSRNELVDVLSLCGLDGIVLVLVVTEVQGEDIWGRHPSPDGGQGPGFNPIENTLKLELVYQVEKRGSLIV